MSTNVTAVCLCTPTSRSLGRNWKAESFKRQKTMSGQLLIFNKYAETLIADVAMQHLRLRTAYQKRQWSHGRTRQALEYRWSWSTEILMVHKPRVPDIGSNQCKALWVPSDEIRINRMVLTTDLQSNPDNFDTVYYPLTSIYENYTLDNRCSNLNFVLYLFLFCSNLFIQ